MRFVKLTGPSPISGDEPDVAAFVDPKRVMAIAEHRDGTALYLEGLAHPFLVKEGIPTVLKKLASLDVSRVDRALEALHKPFTQAPDVRFTDVLTGKPIDNPKAGSLILRPGDEIPCRVSSSDVTFSGPEMMPVTDPPGADDTSTKE